MERLLKNLQTLGRLRDALEPPAPPGAEHVMVEIAPGVFRSLNRQRQPPAAGRLLLELQQARAVHDNLAGQFKRVRDAVKPRNPNPKGAQEIPDAHRSRQR